MYWFSYRHTGDLAHTHFHIGIPRVLYIIFLLHLDNLNAEKSELADHLAVKTVDTLAAEPIFGGHGRKQHRIENLPPLVEQGGELHGPSGVGLGILDRDQISVNVDVPAQIGFEILGAMRSLQRRGAQ